MALSNLPTAIGAFLSALQARDAASMLATLDADAVVVDEGHTWHRGDVPAWLSAIPANRIDSHRPINDARREGQIVISVLTDEPDGKGIVSQVLCDWHFKTRANYLASVRIERRPLPLLPDAVAAFVWSINGFDLQGLLASFVDDALVNDQLHNYWGKVAIREWAEREVIGQRMTLFVVNCVQHYSEVLLTANVNGDFDRRGLPDPLVQAFHFSVLSDRIVQLIILPGEPDR